MSDSMTDDTGANPAPRKRNWIYPEKRNGLTWTLILFWVASAMPSIAAIGVGASVWRSLAVIPLTAIFIFGFAASVGLDFQTLERSSYLILIVGTAFVLLIANHRTQNIIDQAERPYLLLEEQEPSPTPAETHHFARAAAAHRYPAASCEVAG